VISIYVGNLPYDTTEAQLVELFSAHGEVIRAALVTDRETKRPRGFGFVEMENPEEARKAIEALGGEDFNGRPITVNEARRNTQRNSGNTSKSAQNEPATPIDSTYRSADPQDAPPKDSSDDDEDDNLPLSDGTAESTNEADESRGYSNELGTK